MAGVKHTTPADGTFSPGGAAAWDEEHTLSDVPSQAAVDAVSAAVNVVSNALSVETANRVSAVNVVSNKASALSVAVDVVSNAASNALSVANAASNAASVVSVVAANALSKAEAVSNAVSVLSAAHTSLVDRVSANSGTGGVASVTSAEYQSLVDRVSANSGTGGAASVTSNELSAAAAGLSLRVDSVANGVSVVSVAAANALSVANAASNAASVVSAAQAVTSADLTSAKNRLSALSAQVTSADNAISNAVSIVSVAAAAASNAASNALSVANAASNAASIVSVVAANALSVANAASNKASALSVVIAANSGQMTSADNAISAVAANALSKADAVSNALSSWTVSDLADTSVNNITNGQVLGWDSAAAQWIPVTIAGGAISVTSAEYQSLVDRVSANSGAGGGGSVTSTELSAVSANAQSANNVISAKIPWQAAQYRVVSNTQSVAGSALVDISGLVLTVAADETWEIDGMLMFSTSATTVGLRLGTSVPPLSTPRAYAFTRFSGGQSAGMAGGAGQLQVSGASINMSITGAGPAAGVYVVPYKAIFNVASAGTFRMMYGGIASTTASPIHLMPGSYFKAFRIK